MPGMTIAKAGIYASLELNLMMYNRLLPQNVIENLTDCKIASRITSIYDLNGEILFYRVPILNARRHVGFADIARYPGFQVPLISFCVGRTWQEDHIRDEVIREVQSGRRTRPDFDSTRFVAHDFPRISLHYIKDGKTIRSVELGSRRTPISEWSYIDFHQQCFPLKTSRRFFEHLKAWQDRLAMIRRPVSLLRLNPNIFARIFNLPVSSVASLPRYFYICYRPGHMTHRCFERRKVSNDPWCTIATLQMLLDWYRINLSQEEIADDLDVTNEKGFQLNLHKELPDHISKLSSEHLEAYHTDDPTWSFLHGEIIENRPALLTYWRPATNNGQDSHSVAVTGSTISTYFWLETAPDSGIAPAFGLYVFDPARVEDDGDAMSMEWKSLDSHEFDHAVKLWLTP